MDLRRCIRTLIALIVLFAGTASLSACGTQSALFKVGIINTSPSLEPIIDGFKAGLVDLGYEEDKNIIYVYNGPASGNGIATEIRQLIGQRVNVILALSTPAALEAKKLTVDTGIPVIAAPIYKPVDSGLVRSLRQPGENITGIHIEGYIAKELEWLININPRIRRVYTPYNPTDVSSTLVLQDMQTAAKFFGVEIISPEVTNVPEISALLQQMPANVDAIFLIPDATILAKSGDFIRLASERKIPLASISSAQVSDGALFAFGPDFFETGTQCARLADQIFRGVDAGTLPFEGTEFYLSINQNTAAGVGLEFSDKILTAADNIFR